MTGELERSPLQLSRAYGLQIESGLGLVDFYFDLPTSVEIGLVLHVEQSAFEPVCQIWREGLTIKINILYTSKKYKNVRTQWYNAMGAGIAPA